MLRKLLLLSLLTLVATCHAGPPTELASPLVTLATPEKGIVCSGVAVGLNTVLTAKHCLQNNTEEAVSYNGVSCPTDKVVADDGTDNVLVSTCQTYPATAKTAKGALAIGDQVSMWGHAGGLPWLFRRGYLSGAVFTRYVYLDSLSYVFDMSVLPGDSGAPIFNEKNQVVCSVSYSWGMPFKGDQLGACFPLKFTTAQLELIK